MLSSVRGVPNASGDTAGARRAVAARVAHSVHSGASDPAKRLAKSYKNNSVEHLKKVLSDCISESVDLGRHTERVTQVNDSSSQVRAEMVSRTESFYIATKARKQACRQSGVVNAMR